LIESKGYIQKALIDISNEINEILNDLSLPITEKENLKIPLAKKKKVLEQRLKEIEFIGKTCQIDNLNSCKLKYFN
jgi:hypothetical protein